MDKDDKIKRVRELSAEAELERDEFKVRMENRHQRKIIEHDLRWEARLADLERWREQAGLIPLSVRMPAFDEGLRVLVYTEGVDFNGAQFFDVRADDLYNPTSEVEANATHWMPRPLPEPPKVTP